jgi:hypothetical protein
VVETKQEKFSNITSFESDFAKLEWKLEITLSTIKMKKVYDIPDGLGCSTPGASNIPH